MITLMGIAAESKGIVLEKVEAQIEKVMYSDPRRVGEIHVRIGIGDKGYTEREKAILENAAMTCPVSKSLHPDIKQVIAFNYES
jgi:uncharacterized OsmC-like protein